MKKIAGLAIALVTLSIQCQAAKILAVLPLPIASHHTFFKPILQELSARGHDVLVVTMLPNTDAKYKQIIVENSLKKLKDEINFFDMRRSHWAFEFNGLSYLSMVVAHTTFQNPEVQKLIHSTDIHFDAILVESTFVQEAYVAFGHKFKAPIIELHSLCTSFWSNELSRNPNHYSYIVDYKTYATNYMSFKERLRNTIDGMLTSFIFRYLLLPRQQALVDQYMNYSGWESRPSLTEQLSATSLQIVNTHVAMHYPQPNNPNIIYVAGIHMNPPKQLPKDLADFLDSAKEGVIYFCLGSNVKSSTMPEDTKNAFISAFSKLPYKILWKWESDSLPGQPKNVKIAKWLPQTDILNHSNVKAFISHGGILSLTESIYRGVPLIVVPIFGDQPKNSLQIQSSGAGIILDLDNITEESVIWTVNEITKPKYKEAALKQSAILRDNPISPMDSAIYWIEYVIRFKGAEHLQTAAIKLTWYQYHLLDVTATLLAVMLLIIIVGYFSLKMVYKCLCGSAREKKPAKKSKKNN